MSELSKTTPAEPEWVAGKSRRCYCCAEVLDLLWKFVMEFRAIMRLTQRHCSLHLCARHMTH